MKAIMIPFVAAALALPIHAVADETHHAGQQGAAPGATTPDSKTVQKMRDNLTTMRAQLDRLSKAKTAEERQKIMAEHMRTMQDNVGMARGMQPDMMGCAMMQGGGMGMGMMGQGAAGAGDMMAKRMEMMEKRMDMMQMMMQGRMGMPEGKPAMPAN